MTIAQFYPSTFWLAALLLVIYGCVGTEKSD